MKIILEFQVNDPKQSLKNIIIKKFNQKLSILLI